MLDFQSLSLQDVDVSFAYLDSGVPPESQEPYTTIIAVHGWIFAAHVFSRVMHLAPKYNLRFVAVNRRGYGDSTAISDKETDALPEGSDEEKEEYFKARGLEFAGFVQTFVKVNSIPRVTSDGKAGGIALLPWSAGHAIVISALANVESHSPTSRAIFTHYIRSLIMLEPPVITFGFPTVPKHWFPTIMTSISSEHGLQLATTWLTSYFDHGDLSTRDLDSLSYVVPSTERAPSIYNMSPEEHKMIINGAVRGVEAMTACVGPANAAYQRALFDAEIRRRVPNMRVLAICGDRSLNDSPCAFWYMQANDASQGGGHITFKMIPDANHFMRWDSPELFISLCSDFLMMSSATRSSMSPLVDADGSVKV